ncbi:MAG: EamA family transporter [Rhizobiales bacterium]|nr:EamA family transporter [Hyphomicrobiales bacterium]
MKSFWSYTALHIAIFSWGASGIMANLLTLPSAGLVVYRAFIAFAVLLIYNYIMRTQQDMTMRDRIYILFTGVVLGAHWWCFFSGIQYSTVSIGLICISSTPVFVAFIQPFVSKTKIKKSQILLGGLSMVALAIIYNFESNYRFGIFLGITAGFLDAVFTVMASRTKQTLTEASVTQYHTLGAGMVIFVVYGLSEPNWQWVTLQTTADIWGVLFLGIICSALAMSLYLFAMKKLSAFTASLSLSLEAIYGIILALIIFGEREVMSAGLYFGATLLIGCVIADGLWNRHVNARQTQKLSAID